jgi:hypothetical protein
MTLAHLQKSQPFIFLACTMDEIRPFFRKRGLGSSFVPLMTINEFTMINNGLLEQKFTIFLLLWLCFFSQLSKFPKIHF